jgi:Mitochondrial biogenesis AIM24
MGKYSIAEFVNKTQQRDSSTEAFELENAHLLEVKLNGTVWAKAGAMIAYHGQVKFTREGILDRGLGGLLKKAVTGEGMSLMKAEGNGRVYFADFSSSTTKRFASMATMFWRCQIRSTMTSKCCAPLALLALAACSMYGFLAQVISPSAPTMSRSRLWSSPACRYSQTRMRQSLGVAISRRAFIPTFRLKRYWVVAVVNRSS